MAETGMLPLQQERRGGGAEAAEYRCGVFSAHTFRSTLTHPSIRAHSNHPCGTCLVSLLGQVALPRIGMGCATSSRFCKLLVDTSHQALDLLRLPHQAVRLPGASSEGIHKPFTHSTSVTSLSPSPKVSSQTHYPFPSLALTKPAQPVSPWLSQRRELLPHPVRRPPEETIRTPRKRTLQLHLASQLSPRSLLFSPQRPPSAPPEPSRGVGARLCLRPRNAPREHPGRFPAARSPWGPALPSTDRACQGRAAPSTDHRPPGQTAFSPDAGEGGAAPTTLHEPLGTPHTQTSSPSDTLAAGAPSRPSLRGCSGPLTLPRRPQPLPTPEPGPGARGRGPGPESRRAVPLPAEPGSESAASGAPASASSASPPSSAAWLPPPATTGTVGARASRRGLCGAPLRLASPAHPARSARVRPPLRLGAGTRPAPPLVRPARGGEAGGSPG